MDFVTKVRETGNAAILDIFLVYMSRGVRLQPGESVFPFVRFPSIYMYWYMTLAHEYLCCAPTLKLVVKYISGEHATNYTISISVGAGRRIRVGLIDTTHNDTMFTSPENTPSGKVFNWLPERFLK